MPGDDASGRPRPEQSKEYERIPAYGTRPDTPAGRAELHVLQSAEDILETALLLRPGEAALRETLAAGKAGRSSGSTKFLVDTAAELVR